MHLEKNSITPDSIQVLGMRRSGNHAIISWILSNFTGDVCHYNNILIEKDGLFVEDEQIFSKTYNSSGLSCKLYSYEDYSFDKVLPYLNQSDNKVLVLRDPFNVFASRIKRARKIDDIADIFGVLTTRTVLETWKQHAKEFLGRTQHLGKNLIKINFNKWWESIDYRKENADCFGDTNSVEIPSLSKFSNGSSFDGEFYKHNPTEMDLMNRWKEFENDEEFITLFDSETIDLSLEIFGEFPISIKPIDKQQQRMGLMFNEAFCTSHLLLQKGDLDQSKQIVNQVLKIDPGNLKFKYILKEIEKQETSKIVEYIKFDINKKFNSLSEIENKTVLVLCDQGCGDAIQCIRYIPLLKKHGCNIILRCNKDLFKLFDKFPVDEFIDQNKKTLPEHDYHIKLTDLQEVFPLTVDLRKPFIFIGDSIDFGLEGLKVGICWKGNSLHFKDEFRSCSFEVFSEMLKLDKINYVSLQLDHNEDLTRFNVFDARDKITNFQDTAAIINNLDLIITVDTSVMHLSAAMGKETWGMLDFDNDARWGSHSNTTAYYPTLSFFRQSKKGDWASVVKEIKYNLEYMKKKHN